ncbi:hypothetical protein BOTBODRAFT_534088 [Botryobasidium botryosum FD-172 SS1]|uniref:Uncharacterized protein n=1 Tax=Botryobasidium botryosum (strain FD-172 SS1) TaxID=930990 RepID=A0A067M0D3_BOTB1|nr:hypothetical protein BOTBODRAFT_534088 [Botryobasidium botryosum FD-172 SS1]
MDTWTAQFRSWVAFTNMEVCDGAKRDELIEMAKERTTREGRVEVVHCECALLAHQDSYRDRPGITLHGYIGTSSRSCFYCTMFLRWLRD